jgi:hypothetical protein
VAIPLQLEDHLDPTAKWEVYITASNLTCAQYSKQVSDLGIVQITRGRSPVVQNTSLSEALRTCERFRQDPNSCLTVPDLVSS